MKSAVAQYVYLHIDTDKERDNLTAWEKLHPADRKGIPHVQVVSSDGRELHDESGGITADKLRELLTKSGKQLSPAVNAKIKKAHDLAVKALEAGQIAKAVAAITPALGSRGAGEVAQAAEDFGKKLAEQCRADIQEATSQLESEETALQGALTILRVTREYAKLKAVTDDLKKLAKLKAHKDHKTAFDQARPLDGAAAKAAGGNKKDAIKDYQAAIKKYPDSAVSKLAEEKIAELESGVVTPPKKTPQAEDSAAAGAEEKAAGNEEATEATPPKGKSKKAKPAKPKPAEDEEDEETEE